MLAVVAFAFNQSSNPNLSGDSEQRALTHFVQTVAHEPGAAIVKEGNVFLTQFPETNQRRFVQRAVSDFSGICPKPPGREFSVEGKSQRQFNEWIEELQEGSNFISIEAANPYFVLSQPGGAFLEDAGFAAVPRLIQALDDKRVVDPGWIRTFKLGIGNCQRVCDDAAQLLEDISGGELCHNSMGRVSDADLPRMKAESLNWWERVKGDETGWLESKIRSGAYRVQDLAQRLLVLNPRRASTAIIAGFKKEPIPGYRACLIDVLGKTGTPNAQRFIWHELEAGPDMEMRLAAARALVATDRVTAVEAMVREDEKPLDDVNFPSHLDEFLAEEGHAAGLRSMRANLGHYTSARKFNLGFFLINFRTGKIPTSELAGFRREWEALLATMLLDGGPNPNGSANANGHDFKGCRPCDVASYDLANQFGAPYDFVGTHDVAAADRARLANYNVWRRKEGRSSLDKLPSLNHVP